MKSNHLPTRFRIRAIVPALALVVSVAACSSGSSGTKTSSNTDTGGSTTSAPAIGGGTKAKQWTGDPCSLLTATDLSGLSTTWDISSTHANPVAGANPECQYQLQGTGTNQGFNASVHVSVDPLDQFTLNEGIFKAKKISGIGSAAWRGNHDGQTQDTIGVELADVSFRIDAISGLDKNPDDLVALAKAVATHLG